MLYCQTRFDIENFASTFRLWLEYRDVEKMSSSVLVTNWMKSKDPKMFYE